MSLSNVTSNVKHKRCKSALLFQKAVFKFRSFTYDIIIAASMHKHGFLSLEQKRSLFVKLCL